MPAGCVCRGWNEIKYERVIVSGGGTGGHIYPAVAVAEALRRRFGEEVEILFVGAEGKMEMEKVPALGYRIVGSGPVWRGPLAKAGPVFAWKNLLAKSAPFGQGLAPFQKADCRPKKAPGPATDPRRTRSAYLRGRCGRRFRRVCQRPGAVGGAAEWDSDRDSGAELLCGSHQQAAGQACPHDLRVV